MALVKQLRANPKLIADLERIADWQTEVRHRLQNNLPLILNEDANWNHQSCQTKEGYLDEYMAKNLYIISANMLNQAEPEGETSHPKGQFAALVPLDSNYTNAYIITTDDEWFWQAPE